MKFGFRTPSPRKRLAARTSVKRMVRHNLGLKAPRGYGWLTNPKKAAYNRVYSRTTRNTGCLVMLGLAAGVTALLVGLGLSLAQGRIEVHGPASVTDGDTLSIGDVTIRLYGIDAPEYGQACAAEGGGTWRCGEKATDRLVELTASHEAICVGSAFDDYGRLLGTCTVGGTDINGTLVSEGLAWAFVRYATDYVPQEREAKAANLGIWRAPTQTAWDYRAERWNIAEQESPNGCPIKGNISSNGKIYHPPWSPWYSRTKISVEKGERWFCSEKEAIEAGWRAPKWR